VATATVAPTRSGPRLVGTTTAESAVVVPGSDAPVRGFAERLGDAAPILVGGVPYGAEALVARLLEQVLTEVSVPPGAGSIVALVHPDDADQYRIGLWVEAVRLAGIAVDRLELVPRGEALAAASRAGLGESPDASAAAGAAVVALQRRSPETGSTTDTRSVAAPVAAGTVAAGAVVTGTVIDGAVGGAAGAVAADAAAAATGAAYTGEAMAATGAPMGGARTGAAGTAMAAPGAPMAAAGSPWAAPGAGYAGVDVPAGAAARGLTTGLRAARRLPARLPAVLGSAAVVVAAVVTIAVVRHDSSPSAPAVAPTTVTTASQQPPTVAPTTVAPATAPPTTAAATTSAEASTTTAATTTTVTPTTTPASTLPPPIDPTGSYVVTTTCSGNCVGGNDPATITDWDPVAGTFTVRGANPAEASVNGRIVGTSASFDYLIPGSTNVAHYRFTVTADGNVWTGTLFFDTKEMAAITMTRTSPPPTTLGAPTTLAAPTTT
jgi:hypothetical protein